PGQVLEDAGDKPLPGAALVDVLDPHEKAPAAGACPVMTDQGRERMAQMQLAIGARSEPEDGSSGHASRKTPCAGLTAIGLATVLAFEQAVPISWSRAQPFCFVGGTLVCNLHGRADLGLARWNVMGTVVLLDLMGGVALLLWGLHMVQSGILRAFGSDLRHLLSKALANRLAAFAAGLGLTTLLQSSTATALMAASFTVQGVISLASGLAIVLGANVG